ncbi:MAG TPA: metallophosphoesterase [Solirubrobacteraceae bacterium]
MIAQILNQDFLLAAAEHSRLQLKDHLQRLERREAVEAGPLSNLKAEEIGEVVDELDQAIREHEDDAEGGIDASAWMPRTPILAILQTELTRVVAEQHAEMIESDPDGPAQERLADDGEKDSDGRRALGRYEVTRPKILSDPHWLFAGVVIAWHKFKEKAPFGGLPEQAVSIAPNARILLVGDWGSGLPRAQAVAREIRKVLDAGISDGIEQHVVHLGDVYYTGAKHEYEQSFLRHWPVSEGEDVGSYTLCGNHDMYRGGHHYYKTALADPRFARQAGKSVFALRSPAWQLLGLDTAYVDQRLHGGQSAWIGAMLAAAPDTRTALLSHHQLFSAHEDAGEKLRGDIQEVLAGGRIDSWFWAHEHRCIVYEPRDELPFASCVGHGGIPEYLVAREGQPYPPGVRYEYRAKHGNGIEPWGTFGFAVLDLDGPTMRIRYIDENGGLPHHEEVIR